MKPLVSVVVATYRREKDLDNALESLAKQDYSNFEIILVDDNGLSEWNTRVEKIVKEFKKRYRNINLQYIANRSNLGSAKARNVGIEAASGEYVTFLDDDDLYLPKKITRQVSFMESQNIDYSITDLELFNENNRLIDRRTRHYIKNTSPDSLMEYNLKYHITGTDTMMFRKKYILSIGGFPPINVGDEFYLMQQAIEAGGKFGYLSGCDVKAYVHTGDGGLSSGQGKIDGEKSLYNYKKTYFNKLSKGTVKYIKARHYAVMAYAYLRMHCFLGFLRYSLCGFLSSPISFCKILFDR